MSESTLGAAKTGTRPISLISTCVVLLAITLGPWGARTSFAQQSAPLPENRAILTLGSHEIQGLLLHAFPKHTQLKEGSTAPVPVTFLETPAGSRPHLRVTGLYKPKSENTLLFSIGFRERESNPSAIKVRDDGRFSVSFPVPGEQATLNFTEVDIRGQTSKTVFRLSCPSCAKQASPPQSDLPRSSQWTLSPAIGITRLSYSETNITPYSATLLTPKIGVTWNLSNHWSLGANAFLNATSLSESDPVTSVRFLGLNGRIGYAFPLGAGWKTTLMAGAYSLGMTVTNNAFGFRRLIGPQLVIAQQLTLGEASSLGAYAKYALLSKQSTIDLSDRELAGGISYERRIGSQYFALTIDTSVFGFTVGPIRIRSQTTTAGLGMRL